MKTIGKSNAVLIFFLTLFIAYSVMPAVSLFVPAIIRVALLFINVFLLASDAGVSKFFGYLGKLMPLYIIALFTIIQSIISGASVIMFVYDIAGSILISCAGLHLLNNENRNTLSRFLPYVIVIYSITILTTIYGNMLYPNASRLLATGMTGELVMYNQYRAMNIGGFGFVYDIVLPGILLPFVFKQKVMPRVLSLGFYIIILYCAFVSQYTTALLFVLFFGVFFFFNKIRSFRNAAVSAVLLGVLFVIFASTIFYFLSSSIDDGVLSERFQEAGNILSGKEVTEGTDVETRQNLYLESVECFLSSPVFGTGREGGGHSFVLDNMAKYGLFGLFAIILLMRCAFKRYIIPFKSTSFYGYLLFGYMSYIALLFLNPYPMYIGVSFLLPLLAKRIEMTQIK